MLHKYYSKREGSHGTTSYAESIPIEILIAIFTLVHHRDEHSRFRVSFVRRAVVDGCMWPLTLSHVSARWRAVALSTASLWTELVVALPSAANPAEMVQHWLRNAKAMPVDVTIWCDSNVEATDRDRQWLIHSVARSLGSHASSIRSLKLACSIEGEFRILLSELDRAGPFSLQTLQIDPTPNIGYKPTMSPLPRIPSNLLAGDMLTTFRVKSFYICLDTTLSVIPTSLTTLKLEGDGDYNPPSASHTSYNAIRLLSMLPQLERLHLGGKEPLSNRLSPNNPEGALALLRLKKLTLVGSACARLLGYLTTPSLECLKLGETEMAYGSSQWASMGGVLKVYLKRSMPPVTRFSLMNIAMGIGRLDLVDWLRGMEDLQVLTLAIRSDLLRAVRMAFMEGDGDMICPRLSELRWRATTPNTKIDWSALGERRGRLEICELGPWPSQGDRAEDCIFGN